MGESHGRETGEIGPAEAGLPILLDGVWRIREEHQHVRASLTKAETTGCLAHQRYSA